MNNEKSKKLTAEDKRVIAAKTGFNFHIVGRMISGAYPMRPSVKKAIEKWIDIKEKFMNS